MNDINDLFDEYPYLYLNGLYYNLKDAGFERNIYCLTKEQFKYFKLPIKHMPLVAKFAKSYIRLSVDNEKYKILRHDGNNFYITNINNIILTPKEKEAIQTIKLMKNI